MKVVIVSDTHGSFNAMKEIIQGEKPFDVLIHCGDVCGNLKSVLGRTDYQVKAVAGNCDMPGSYPDELYVDLLNHKALVTHGHRYLVSGTNRGRLLGAARKKGCDIICFGHTHVPEIEERIGALIINPGSLTRPRTPDKLPSYAVLEIDDASGKMSSKIMY